MPPSRRARARCAHGRPRSARRRNRRQPSRGCCSRNCRACPASTLSGTLLWRSRLRARHSASGVAKATQTHGIAYWCASANHSRRRSGSRPSVSTTVVSRRFVLRSTICSSRRERVVARGDVVLACTDDGTQRVTRHDLHRREVSRRPRALARPRRAHQHHQARRREHHVVACRVFVVHQRSASRETFSAVSCQGRSRDVDARNVLRVQLTWTGYRVCR